jgi:hypothetical protein
VDASRLPPPPPKPDNQRRHPRYELLASVELHQGDDTLILPARNLSLGGIYLGSDGNDLSRFTVDDVIEVLVFDATDEERPAVRAAAIVVRHDEQGMALKWMESSETFFALSQLLEAVKNAARNAR